MLPRIPYTRNNFIFDVYDAGLSVFPEIGSQKHHIVFRYNGYRIFVIPGIKFLISVPVVDILLFDIVIIRFILKIYVTTYIKLVNDGIFEIWIVSVKKYTPTGCLVHCEYVGKKRIIRNTIFQFKDIFTVIWDNLEHLIVSEIVPLKRIGISGRYSCLYIRELYADNTKLTNVVYIITCDCVVC